MLHVLEPAPSTPWDTSITGATNPQISREPPCLSSTSTVPSSSSPPRALLSTRRKTRQPNRAPHLEQGVGASNGEHGRGNDAPSIPLHMEQRLARKEALDICVLMNYISSHTLKETKYF